MTVRPVHVFVAADGNAFMGEIAAAIAEACTIAGRDAMVICDRLPTGGDAIELVVAPHELFQLTAGTPDELRRAAANCVCIGTEQPGTVWFERTIDACRLGPMALDINAHGVAGLRAAGIDAHRLPLGAVPSMRGRPHPPGIDVVFLGAIDERRAQLLASVAGELARRRTELRLFAGDRPVGEAAPGLVFGRAKYDLLARSRVLVNLHRHHPGSQEAPTYFEWARAVEAMANGCVVVTEPASGMEPLVDGVHLVTAPPDQLAGTLAALLDDEPRRASIAAAAREVVTGPLALATTMARLLPEIEAACAARQDAEPLRVSWRFGSDEGRTGSLPVFAPHLDLQRRLKRLARAEDDALRRLDAVACRLRHGEAQHVERTVTPAYETATPAVTVAVSVYDYEDVVEETLTSIVRSEGIDFEVVVVDDHATDASRSVVTSFLHAHPDVPMMLLAKEANEGLSAARNTAFEHARAELVMVVDADNHVYPHCLRRLAATLADDPAADGAYGILEDFGASTGLRSALGWDVARLCRANDIDAQAMIRRSAWERLGGYRPDDDEVYGWEDWDLWLRIAQAGGHLAMCPEILGRYRTQRSSMVTLSNVAATDAIAAMRRRHPGLPWPR